MWCKLIYALGIIHPTETTFDPATELAIQKAFFDHMNAIPLRRMISMIDDCDMPSLSLNDTATNLNIGTAAHAGELRSFEQTYATEVRGIVDLVGATAADVMVTMARNQGVERPTAEQQRTSENALKNLLAIVLEKNKAREALPTMHILASLHASVRWNKGRRFKGNDLFDFGHAAAALAYGDAFFTERPLHTMVTERHLGLDRLYECQVASDLEGAITWVASVLRE